MFSRTLEDGTLPHPSCCSTPKGKVTIAMVTPKFSIDSGNLKFIKQKQHSYIIERPSTQVTMLRPITSAKNALNRSLIFFTGYFPRAIMIPIRTAKIIPRAKKS